MSVPRAAAERLRAAPKRGSSFSGASAEPDPAGGGWGGDRGSEGELGRAAAIRVAKTVYKKHTEAQQAGQTCIDCHKGIAHHLPKEYRDPNEEE